MVLVTIADKKIVFSVRNTNTLQYPLEVKIDKTDENFESYFNQTLSFIGQMVS